MKKVSYRTEKYIDLVKGDLTNMVQWAKEEGFLVDIETMYDIWRDYSDDYCAGWLNSRKELVIEAIKEKGVIE